MGFIDFHCHLGFDDYAGTWKGIIDQCFSSGFSGLVTVADPHESNSFTKTMEIVGYHEQIYCISAVHPHNADHYSLDIEKRILSFIKNEKVIGVGETGLDFYYHHSTAENQIAVFKRQLQVARDLSLPVIIHSRNAEREVLDILSDVGFNLPVIFHCYTGNQEMAQEIIQRQYCISFSGIVTFKKANYLRDIVAMVPLQQIFTETDSPFLSPDPFRGKTNSPLRVELVARKIAEIKEIGVERLNQAVNENFERIFSV